MKKQVYILATILLVFFAFYSVYYYSNYRIRNLPVISRVEKLNKSRMVRQPKTSALKDTNLLYGPCFQEASLAKFPRFKNSFGKKANPWLPKDSGWLEVGASPPNVHCICKQGVFNDTTPQALQLLQNKWFHDDFQVLTSLPDGTPYLFSHFYHKVIFKNQFRVHRNGIEFQNDTVKAINCYGDMAKGRQTVYVYRAGERPIITIESENGGRMVYAIPKRPSTLKESYETITKVIKNQEGRILSDTSELVIPIMDFHLSERLPGLINGREQKVTGIRRISLSMNAEFSALNKPEGSSKATITFDEPYLFFYNRKSDQRPYLLTWITDPELLLSEGRKSS